MEFSGITLEVFVFLAMQHGDLHSLNFHWTTREAQDSLILSVTINDHNYFCDLAQIGPHLSVKLKAFQLASMFFGITHPSLSNTLLYDTDDIPDSFHIFPAPELASGDSKAP